MRQIGNEEWTNKNVWNHQWDDKNKKRNKESATFPLSIVAALLPKASEFN